MSIGPVQWSTTCVIALLAVLMLAGCGDEPAEESTAESTEDNALSSVCDARADIDDQMLARLTASTVTADKVSQSADAIAGDLTETHELADSYRNTFAPSDCS